MLVVLIFLAYFQDGCQSVNGKQRVAHPSKYWFDFDDVSVSLLANNALRAHHANAHGGMSTNGLSYTWLFFLK